MAIFTFNGHRLLAILNATKNRLAILNERSCAAGCPVGVDDKNRKICPLSVLGAQPIGS
jgi:hypothetical protein